MEREDVAHLPYARFWLCSLCEGARSKVNEIGHEGHQVFVSQILQRHQGVSANLLGDKENHQEFRRGVFQRQNIFGRLSKKES